MEILLAVIFLISFTKNEYKRTKLGESFFILKKNLILDVNKIDFFVLILLILEMIFFSISNKIDIKFIISDLIIIAYYVYYALINKAIFEKGITVFNRLILFSEIKAINWIKKDDYYQLELQSNKSIYNRFNLTVLASEKEQIDTIINDNIIRNSTTV